MRNALYVASKELRSYFVSPIAYIIVAFWLVITGLFFTSSATAGDASMRNVFGVIPILLLLISPALTMRLLAEESRTGTLELLLTAPVKDWSVVVGKFLGALGLYIAMMFLTILYPLILLLFRGDPDWGPIWSGYLGLLLLGMAFLSVGLFASSLTSNQILSAVIALAILLVLFIITVLTSNVAPNVAAILAKLSIGDRYDPFTRGIVDLTDVVYFLTFTGAVLFITVQIVEARRYRA
ncbi:MAG: gliding motility-associated transport system permease protein [Chloroflexia bacterium]|jgi:ABC-2 type transport system permease protein|nr:gliding motility-associated transport system permease protein [Chloroflexia bacterium]